MSKKNIQKFKNSKIKERMDKGVVAKIRKKIKKKESQMKKVYSQCLVSERGTYIKFQNTFLH